MRLFSFRSSHRRCSVKGLFRPEDLHLYEKEMPAQVFSCKIGVEFLKTPILNKICERLFYSLFCGCLLKKLPLKDICLSDV